MVISHHICGDLGGNHTYNNVIFSDFIAKVFLIPS